MKTKKKMGAAECGDCNTCGKCEELEQAQEMQGFNEAVYAAAAIERDSFEKNLARQRRATLAQDMAKGGQQETFKRNAVARPAVPGHEGALLSHDGLTLYTLIVYSENFAGILNQITAPQCMRLFHSWCPQVHDYLLLQAGDGRDADQANRKEG